MPEWFSPERGYYIAKYRGKTLEVVRNTDASDKRRYVARVDGVILPHPCHTIPQCKTKAMKWADSPAFQEVSEPRPPPEETNDRVNGRTAGAVVPYVEFGIQTPTEPKPNPGDSGEVTLVFTITGGLPVTDKLAAAVSNLQAAVELLREEGGTVECFIELPCKVKL